MFESPTYQALFDRIAAVRAHRDAFLAEVESVPLSLAEVFERSSRDPVLSTIKILPTLEAIPGMGKVQTRRALADVGVGEDALIGDVAAEVHDELPAALGRHER